MTNTTAIAVRLSFLMMTFIATSADGSTGRSLVNPIVSTNSGLIKINGSLALPPGSLYLENDRVFLIYSCVNDIEEFKRLVKQAARLKTYGRVQVNIGTLSDKSFYEIPKGGNPWNEYASNNATVYKFFPDPKIARFIPAEFVRKNRELLLAKARILKENGVEGAFFGSEPDFLPDAFYDAYPHLRGPRVDHPRRSDVKAFSPCFSVKETRDMYSGMIAQMLKQVPEISSYYFKTNDAGSGICWSDWLYSGPNGPAVCQGTGAGERVALVLSALQNGAEKAGRKLSVYLSEGSSNFTDNEKKDIQKHLPANCYYQNTESHEIINLSSLISTSYPVKGVFNPLSFLKSIRSLGKEPGKSIILGLRAFYDRGGENAEVSGLLIGMIEQKLREASSNEVRTPEESLLQLCQELAGSASADRLFKAFVALEEALKDKDSGMRRVHSMNWGVAARHITRPLLIAPQRATPNEESYFLPFVFNVSRDEARMDYTDIQGGHVSIPDGAAAAYAAGIDQVAEQFDQIDRSAPKYASIRQLSLSLRMYANIMRSCGNFAEAQAIRERNAEKLKSPVHRPDKVPTWEGDKDFLRFNQIKRSELDNAQQLIGLLENGGIKLLCLAPDAQHEDTFVLGPDLIAQIKKKRSIMLTHWLDIEGYLASPFK